ncbi:unnamed protein product [Diamesa tonsa]
MKCAELSNKFYYFGFGSNLLSKRIKVLNKSAERVTAGKLVDFRLEFAETTYFSPTWNGCPATIIENPGSIVYGAVWTIDNDQLHELDRQEGVDVSLYKPMTVKVLINDDKEEIECRTYQLVNNPENILEPEDRTNERQPSKTYLNVIVNGALESKLPSDYVEFLKRFKHNGNLAIDKDLVAKLDLKDVIV